MQSQRDPARVFYIWQKHGMNTIASRLVFAREQKGLTQAQLAKMCKLSQSTIGNIEAGIRDGLQSAAVIAQALDVRYEWLRDGEEPMRPSVAPWPFRSVSRDQWDELSDWQKGRAEEAFRQAMAQIESEIASRKQAANGA